MDGFYSPGKERLHALGAISTLHKPIRQKSRETRGPAEYPGLLFPADPAERSRGELFVAGPENVAGRVRNRSGRILPAGRDSTGPRRRRARLCSGGQDYVLAGKTMFWRARLCSGGQGLCPGGQGYVLAGKAYVLAGKAMSWRTRTMSWRARLMSWRARLCPGGQGYVLAGKAMSWRARLCPGGQGYVLAGKAMSWRARLCPGGQGYVLADKTMSWRTRSFPGKHEPRFRSRFTADARYVQYGFRRRLQTRRTLPFGSMTAISK